MTSPHDEPAYPLFISVTKAAEKMGVSRYFVYELVKEGEVPSRKVGRRILVDRAAFDEYLAGLPSAAEAAS